MYQLRCTVVVDAPVQTVFECARAADLYELSTGAELVPPGMIGGSLTVGALLRLRARRLGRARPVELRVVALAPAERIVLEQVRGPWRSLRLTHAFGVTGAGVLVTDDLQWLTPYGGVGRAADETVLRQWAIHVLRKRSAELSRRSTETGGLYAVGAAILDEQGRVLAAQRDRPSRLAGKWEFPGGKLQAGEGDIAALIRECREELGVEVVVSRYLGEVVLPDGGRRLRVWVARIVAGQPRAVEHRELRWVGADEIDGLDWLEPDRPLLQALKPLLSPRG